MSGNDLSLLFPGGSVDLYHVNPRYFVKGNPQGRFRGLTRRRMRLYPAMSEETAYSLPGFLGPRELTQSANSPTRVAQGLRAQADPRGWLT